MLIGLTGQIGSGKSEIAKYLREKGATVIEADEIGRQVVEQSGELLGQLISVFGSDILDGQGHLDRAKLASLAFATPEDKAKLDALVHPLLLSELASQVAAAEPENNLVLIDAALLLDWGLGERVEQVWVVEASEETRLKRLAHRGFDEADARARQSVQLSAEEFRAQATLLIDNNGSPSDLHQQLDKILSSLSG